MQHRHHPLYRPPLAMCALGIQWLAQLCQPQRFTLELRRETRGFHQLFLHTTPAAADLDALLPRL